MSSPQSKQAARNETTSEATAKQQQPATTRSLPQLVDVKKRQVSDFWLLSPSEPTFGKATHNSFDPNQPQSKGSAAATAASSSSQPSSQSQRSDGTGSSVQSEFNSNVAPIGGNNDSKKSQDGKQKEKKLFVDSEYIDLKTQTMLRQSHPHYVIGEMIAHGSYGQVFKAQVPSVNRRLEFDQCAIKVMYFDMYYGMEHFAQKYWPRELDALRRVEHPFIVRTYDVFEINRRHFIVMEYVEGGTLYEYGKRKGALSERNACYVFTQIAYALNYLHLDLRIAHRDIKLENVLMKPITVPLPTQPNVAVESDPNNDNNNGGGRGSGGGSPTPGRPTKRTLRRYCVKLTDFGFARAAWDEETDSPIMSQTYCGTLPYFSPQILAELPYDPFSADIWALGVLLYAVTHRRFPFNCSDTFEMREQQVEIQRSEEKFNDIVDPMWPPDMRALLRQMFILSGSLRINIWHVLESPWIARNKQFQGHCKCHPKPMI